MKKVAIVTLNHGFNYGNKLQNYAVEQTYLKLGVYPKTIKYYPVGAKVEKNNRKWDINTLCNKIQSKVENIIYAQNKADRLKSFELFNDKYLHFTEKCYTPTDYMTVPEEEYNFFSVGSDQVWNSYFFDFSKIYLLNFVKDNSKKIAFSASFGVDTIKEEYKNDFKNAFLNFKFISVREEQGKKLIKDTVGRKNVEVVIDPTLMLTADEWTKIASNININEKYVLTYFLGDISSKRSKIIKDYAKKKGLKIINLNCIQNTFYKWGPTEFIGALKNAEMIFTDSFHACCFSLQFHKKFWVMERVSSSKNMGSRIETFMKLFGLKDRKFFEGCDLDSSVDFKIADERLEFERKRFEKLLRNTLGVNEE